MASQRDEFLSAYSDHDWVRLRPFLTRDSVAEFLLGLRQCPQLTREASRWLLDSWDADDAAHVPTPVPPANTNVKWIGGVNV